MFGQSSPHPLQRVLHGSEVIVPCRSMSCLTEISGTGETAPASRGSAKPRAAARR